MVLGRGVALATTTVRHDWQYPTADRGSDLGGEGLDAYSRAMLQLLEELYTGSYEKDCCAQKNTV
jgi:hypothetical protein